MSPAGYAASQRDSTAAAKRGAAFAPRSRTQDVQADVRHVTYRSQPEGDPTYEVHPGASFDVDYQRSGGCWVIWDRATGIYGSGERILDARKDFMQAVEQHLDVLERQAALSENLTWQLNYLRARTGR